MPQYGILDIKANNVNFEGTPPPIPYIEDLNSLTYEDYDVTDYLLKTTPMSHGNARGVSRDLLNTNIPYINGRNPTVDYNSLRILPNYITEVLDDKIPVIGGKYFLKKIVLPNQQNLRTDTDIIPDMDCLFYKSVSGIQHLFIRLSSETRRKAELKKRNSNKKTIYSGNADVYISSENAKIDHADIEAKNFICNIKNEFDNYGSKIKAQDTIKIKAHKQTNKTIVNKSVWEIRSSDYFLHEERIESVDPCIYMGNHVIQEGDEVENIGMTVVANNYEDRATHTRNMPVKTTLVNHEWKKESNLFSSATAEVKRRDDVLFPTNYIVDSYKSTSSKPGSSVEFGKTNIKANSKIIIEKDIKKDVPIEEIHTIETHITRSGFIFPGLGVSAPDVTPIYKKLENAYNSGNMIAITGATLKTIGMAKKGIEAVKNIDKLGTAISKITPTDIFLCLSKFINGPSIQFGSRSIDIGQNMTITHGNTFISPYQSYQCKESASFGGEYIGKEIKIKTGTFITFDLPQTMEMEMEVHQSGINMDLLTFAVMLLAPETSSAMNAALASSTVNISYQSNQIRQVNHIPTVIKAEKLSIEADNGYLTQAQIKAGIIHAIFSNDLVIKSLTNEKYQRCEGGGVSMGLSALSGFESLASALVDTALDATISSQDSGEFEKIIDNYASMVGVEEFYLKVGGILRTESAFVGHIEHDANSEYIEAGEIQKIDVEEFRESWDRSYSFTIRGLIQEIQDKIQLITNNEFVQSFIRDPENFAEEAIGIIETKINGMLESIQNVFDNPDEIPDMAIKLIEKKYEKYVGRDIRELLENPENLTEILERKYDSLVNEKIQEYIDHPEKIPEAISELIEKKCDEIIGKEIQEIFDHPETIPEAISELIEKKCDELLNENIRDIVNNPERMADLLSELVEENFNKIITEKMNEMIEHPEKIPQALGELLEKTIDEKMEIFHDQPEKIIEELFEYIEKDLLEGAEEDMKKLIENLKKLPSTMKETLEKQSEIMEEYARLVVNDPEKLSRLLKEKYNEKFEEDIKLFTSKRKRVPDSVWKLLKEKYTDLFNEDIQQFIESPERLREGRLVHLKEKYDYLIDENILVLFSNPKSIPNAAWILLKERYVRKINHKINKYRNDITSVPERAWKLLREKMNEIIDENVEIFIRDPGEMMKTKMNSFKERYIERFSSSIQKEINKGKSGIKEMAGNYQKIVNIQYRLKTELKKTSNEIREKIYVEMKVKRLIRRNLSKLNGDNMKNSLLRNLKGKKRVY